MSNSDSAVVDRLRRLESQPGGKDARAMFGVLADLVRDNKDADSILLPFQVTDGDRMDVKRAMFLLSNFLTDEMGATSTRIIETGDLVTLEVNR